MSRSPLSPCASALALLALTLSAACAGGPEPPGHQDGPPALAAVRDGLGPDLDVQEVTTSLFANWDAFVDPEGSPVVYEWSIGTSRDADDVLPWTRVGGATTASTDANSIDLPAAQTLYVSVRATDLAGNRSGAASSDGIVIGVPRVAPAPIPPPTPGPSRADPMTAEKPSVDHVLGLQRFDISWTFAKPVLSGRFANGDCWVVGPVDIVAISPPCRVEQGRVRNGAMVNPDPTRLQQGYDSAMFGGGLAASYEPALNVALGIAADSPLRLEPGSSLVSVTSAEPAGAMPQLETCVVLTVLAEAPPADAFRPPYCGTDKTCRWRASALDLTRLAGLESVAGAPRLDDLHARFERTWLDHFPGWQGRYLHPRANMPDYGRDIADLVGTAALTLQLDAPEAAKLPLAIGLTQLGIDCHGIVQAGGRFVADGGSGAGRKFPVLFAGALLQDEELLRSAAESRFAFAEDAQTFYVEESDDGLVNHGHGGYDRRDVGLAEWGQRHHDDARFDKKTWTADPYRRCCSANAWNGFVLAARIMGLRQAWGHDALFDYVDRYMQIETRGQWTRAWSPFAERMWDRYRGDH